VIEDGQDGAGCPGLPGRFLHFSRSDKRGAFDAFARLQNGTRDFGAGAAHQRRQLFERLLGRIVRPAAGRAPALPGAAFDFQTDQQGAFRNRPRAQR